MKKYKITVQNHYSEDRVEIGRRIKNLLPEGSNLTGELAVSGKREASMYFDFAGSDSEITVLLEKIKQVVLPSFAPPTIKVVISEFCKVKKAA